MQPPCASPGDATLLVSLGALSLNAPPHFLDLLALPRLLVVAIFALLPVDTRLRCSEVNRAWRALLADTAFYERLDLSVSSGLARFSEALFRAAIAKAGGQLRELNVDGRGKETLSTRTLLDALASNAASLKQLNTCSSPYFTPAEAEEFLEAAHLSVCHMSVEADNVELVRRCLRNDPPYGRLRLNGLYVQGEGQLDSLQNLKAFCTDLIKHPSLTGIIIIHQASLGTAAAMRVFVNAAIALRVLVICLIFCGCTRFCVPELTRLIEAPGLVRNISIDIDDVELFEAGAETDQFCAAARASASLKHLTLNECGTNPDAAAVAAFINARRR